MRAWNEENVSDVRTGILLRSHHALREALAVLNESAAFSTRHVASDMMVDLRVLQGELHRREALGRPCYNEEGLEGPKAAIR